MRTFAYLVCVLLALSAASSAAASESVGSPNRGRLEGGISPENSLSLRVLPGYVAQGVVFGHPDLVALLERASDKVAKRFPGSQLGIGGLSRKSGGDVGGHASHESGRDADVGFYRTTLRGKMMGATGFSRVYKTGVSGDGSKFDVARNWAFVEALLSDPHVHVTNLFVASHLKRRLLEEAARAGASERLRSMAEDVLMQPRHAQPHDDHFHIRISCPRDSQQCVEVAEAPHAVARARARVAHRSSAPKASAFAVPSVNEPSTSRAPAPAPVAAPRTVPRRVPQTPPSRFGAPLVKPLQRVQSNESASPLLDLIGPRVEGLDSAAINQPK